MQHKQEVKKCKADVPTHDKDGTMKDSDYWFMCLKDRPCPVHDSINTIIEDEKKEFIEKGADIEHERWSRWQAYLHSKCVEHSDGKGEWVCFPSELFKRWERQINTPYSELSEAEKESDRKEVRSYDALLTTAMQRAYEVGANNERASWLRSEVEKLESAEMVKSNIITRYKEELLELEKGV